MEKEGTFLFDLIGSSQEYRDYCNRIVQSYQVTPGAGSQEQAEKCSNCSVLLHQELRKESKEMSYNEKGEVINQQTVIICANSESCEKRCRVVKLKRSLNEIEKYLCQIALAQEQNKDIGDAYKSFIKNIVVYCKMYNEGNFFEGDKAKSDSFIKVHEKEGELSSLGDTIKNYLNISRIVKLSEAG
jgi:hypothetical protein